MNNVQDTTDLAINVLKYSGTISVAASAIYSFLNNNSGFFVSIGAILGITMHVLALIGYLKRRKNGTVKKNTRNNT